MTVRIFDGGEGTFMSQRGVDVEIPGGVRVLIDEAADPQEVVTALLHIAHWIEKDARLISDSE